MYIKAEERGLLYRRGRLSGVLLSGRHFISPFDRVEVHAVEAAVQSRSSALETVLAVPLIREQLELVEVPDNHIALHWRDGNLIGVLSPGKTAFWKGLGERRFQLIDLDRSEAEDCARAILLHPAVRDFVLSYTVEPYQRGLLYIDKAFVRELESGNWFFWKGSRSINVEKIDLRLQQLEVTGQEIMSRDKVPLRLNVFCQYRIVDPMKAVGAKDAESQLHVILQLALREYVGSLSLDEILDKKEEIGRYVGAAIAERATGLGVEIGFAGIKDVILPGEIRDIMNQVLVAEKKAQANVIMRREETASTRSLLNTAKLMEENEVLYRLKELEYIERISAQIKEINVGDGGRIIDQLRSLFVPAQS